MKTVDNKNNFIFDVDGIPDWFRQETSRGRAKVVLDDDNEPVKAIIYSGTKNYEAYPGDTILRTKNGMIVLKAKDAKKYGVMKEEE